MKQYKKMAELVSMVAILVMVLGCSNTHEKEVAPVEEVGTMESLGKQADAKITVASDAIDSAVDSTKDVLDGVAEQAMEIADQTKVVVNDTVANAKDVIDKSKGVATDLANEMMPKLEEAQKALEKAAAESGKTIDQLKADLGAAIKKSAASVPPTPPVD